MKRFVYILLTISILLSVCWISGCASETPLPPLAPPDELDDFAIKKQLLDFDFSYSGMNVRPLNDLWVGYDNAQKGYEPDYYPEYYGVCNTYLTDYQEYNPEYYFVYLKKNYIAHCINYMNAYESSNRDPWYDYNFAPYDNQRFVDGKYLMAFLAFNLQPYEHLKFCVADSIEDIPFYYDNQYQLVFCAQSRPSVIKENLTTGEVLNKEIVIYNRVILSYDEKLYHSHRATATYDNTEVFAEFSGELIESFPVEYEEMMYTNYPHRGNKGGYAAVSVAAMVVNETDARYILLPRYKRIGSRVEVDYLVADAHYSWTADPSTDTIYCPIKNIYEGLHSYFSSAFVRLYDSDVESVKFDLRKIRYLYANKDYFYGLFDYGLVCEIIRR